MRENIDPLTCTCTLHTTAIGAAIQSNRQTAAATLQTIVTRQQWHRTDLTHCAMHGEATMTMKKHKQSLTLAKAVVQDKEIEYVQ